jgi:hypothetical protein
MKRVMIVSDTHGRHSALKLALEREKQEGIDMLLHLGDVQGEEDYITALAECPTHIVRGNNDFFSDLPDEEEVQIGNHRVLLTHGHNYYVSVGHARIRQEAKERGFDTVMYGHTHKPYLDVGMGDAVTLINPGSIAYPRQNPRKGTYIILEVPNEGDVRYNLKYV